MIVLNKKSNVQNLLNEVEYTINLLENNELNKNYSLLL